MAINLVDLFKEQLTDGVLDKVSGLVGGGDSGSVQKGLMAAAPALLGGIMDKASSNEGASSLFNMLGDGSELGNLANLASGSSESEGFLSKGMDLVKMVLGDKASGIIDMISSVSGMGSDASSSLLGTAGSILGGVLGKQKASGLDLGSFVGLLSNQGSILDKLAPAGLTSLLGLSSFSGISGKLGDLATGALGFAGDTGKAAIDGAGKVIGGAADLASDTGKAALDGAGKVAGAAAGLAGDAGKAALDGAAGAVNAGGSLIKKILPWAIGILGLLFAFFLIRGCDSDKSVLDNVKDAANQTTGTVSDAANSTVDAAGNAVDVASDAAGNAVDAAGNAVDAAGNAISNVAGGIVDASGNIVNAFGEAIGKFFDFSLPNGTKLSIPEGGFESNFLAFLKDGKMEAGKYYAFDRLYFNTGSSALSEDSVNQIENVAAIMKAYPDVKVLLRGHTDNTGSVEGNNKLSASRALAVKNTLVAKGIDASRLSTKGMGSAEPIAGNDTPEGRQKNRRIDVSVVK